MLKNKLQITEDELLSDDGIFSIKQKERFDNAEKCCYCGYEMLDGEEAVEIYCNGDVIHKSCWTEYADENMEVFGKCFTTNNNNQQGGINLWDEK